MSRENKETSGDPKSFGAGQSSDTPTDAGFTNHQMERIRRSMAVSSQIPNPSGELHKCGRHRQIT